MPDRDDDERVEPLCWIILIIYYNLFLNPQSDEGKFVKQELEKMFVCLFMTMISIIFASIVAIALNRARCSSSIRFAVIVPIYFDLKFIFHEWSQTFERFINMPDNNSESIHFNVVSTGMFIYLSLLVLGSMLLLMIVTCFICFGMSLDDDSNNDEDFQREDNARRYSSLDEMNIPKYDYCQISTITDSCSICLVDFAESLDQKVLQLKCHQDHVFHYSCLDDYYKYGQNQGHRGR